MAHLYLLLLLLQVLYPTLTAAIPFPQPKHDCSHDEVFKLFSQWRDIAEPWCHTQVVYTATTTVTHTIHQEIVAFVTSTSTAKANTKTITSTIPVRTTTTKTSTFLSTIVTVQTSDTTTTKTSLTTSNTEKTSTVTETDTLTTTTTTSTTSTTPTPMMTLRRRAKDRALVEEEESCIREDDHRPDPHHWLQQYGSDRCQQACSCLIDETRTKTALATTVKTVTQSKQTIKTPVPATQTLLKTTTVSTVVSVTDATSLTTTTSTSTETDTTTVSPTTILTSTTLVTTTTDTYTTTTTTVTVTVASPAVAPRCFQLTGNGVYAGSVLSVQAEYDSVATFGSDVPNSYFYININSQLVSIANEDNGGDVGIAVVNADAADIIDQIQFGNPGDGDMGIISPYCSIDSVDTSVASSGFALTCTVSNGNTEPLDNFKYCTQQGGPSYLAINDDNAETTGVSNCEDQVLNLGVIAADNCNCDYTCNG